MAVKSHPKTKPHSSPRDIGRDIERVRSDIWQLELDFHEHRIPYNEYTERLRRLKNREEELKTSKITAKTGIRMKSLYIVGALLLSVVPIYFIYRTIRRISVKSSFTEPVAYIGDFSAPLTGSTDLDPFLIREGDFSATISPQSSVTVEGRAVYYKEHHFYPRDDSLGPFSPVDIVVAWGDLVRHTDELVFRGAGSRRLVYGCKKPDSWCAENVETIRNSLILLHLVPSKDTKSRIKSVRKNDYLRVSGLYAKVSTNYRSFLSYIVPYEDIERDWAGLFGTSPHFVDSEALYVTDMVWLK